MVDGLRKLHSSLPSFCQAYSDKLQDTVSKCEREALLSEKSPFLVVIEKTYGENSAVQWLMMQLSAFNEYCGKKEKMDDWQIENLARNIVNRYGWLKASEILLFLNRYKNGELGPMYGTVDPQDFMVVFIERFLPWRGMMIDKYEREAKRESERKQQRVTLKPEQIKALRERLDDTSNKLKTN